ncbi:MAG: hypothetical protein WBP93_07165 [Pyrinomonadaceae bacterium]
MGQIWTIIFVTLLAIGWGIASWHDRKEQKQHQQRKAASDKSDEKEV